MGVMRNAYKILVAKSEGKLPLERCMSGWEHNIRTGLREIESEGVVWMYLVLDRDQWQALVKTVMNLQVS
jgi:hypothetical protein